RADPPPRRRDARQLRDEAPVREADRDHARARAGGRDDAGRPPRPALPAVPPGGGALHAADARGIANRFCADPRAARTRAGAAARTARGAGRGGASRAARPFLSDRRTDGPAETAALAAELAR